MFTFGLASKTVTLFILHSQYCHCVKSVRIRSYSGPYFLAFGLNTDQNNSEYGLFYAACTVNIALCDTKKAITFSYLITGSKILIQADDYSQCFALFRFTQVTKTKFTFDSSLHFCV